MLKIPYGKHFISKSDISAVNDVLNSAHITQGPLVTNFENKLLKKVDAKYGVAVNSATSALHVACLSLGIKKGDIVWTSPITFVASANCAKFCGAEIDFVDVDNYGLMSVKSLEKKLIQAKKNKSLPKVVIPVHLAGSSCDMKKIKMLSVKFGFYLIEDASHAIGGEYNKSKVGSCKYSDICVFSFHPVKIITTAEGGLATTNNDIFARKMRLFSSHGITKNNDEFDFKNQGSWHYEQQMLGYNYRMNELQAALGISQIKRLKKIVNERNKIYQIYKKELNDLNISVLEIPKNVRSSVHLAIIKVNINLHKELFERLRLAGIGVQLHYQPVHLQPYYRRLGFKEGDFINSENYAKQAITVPLYPGLGKNKQKFIINKIKSIFNHINV